MLKILSRSTRFLGLSAIIVLMVISVGQTEIATLDESRLVCRNWLSYIAYQKGGWAGATNPDVIATEDIVVSDTLLGRYFSIYPSGYVVVPALKQLPPIKACSEKYQLDLNEPDGFAAMLKEVLQHRMRQYVETYGSLEAVQPAVGDVLLGREHRQDWGKFLLEESDFEAELTAKGVRATAEVGPLLTTSWHQNDPYNLLCPWGDGGRCVVGCVATATAQILAYHRWPLEGTGFYQYWWPGDYSCGGSTSGQLLSADFSDPYDWENIPDNCNTGCTSEQEDALAELSYEVGVAFNMDYGRCGSGAYTYDAQYVFPTFFRYYDWIERHDRAYYSLTTWSDILRAEIEAGRPMQYRIYTHSIVCDGWRMYESMHQVHMNYGWGGSHNAWYTLDNLYCPWSGCAPSEEYIIIKIEPDRGVFFAADTTWGDVPLTVQFSGSSTLPVDAWTWDFGDGDSAFIQSPAHVYDVPGRYSVTLMVTSGTEQPVYTATNYITAMADSLIGAKVQGDPGTQVEVVINAANTVPLRQLKIPVEFSGDLDITLDSFSTAGCRTDYFDYKAQISFDPFNRRMAFSLYNTQSSTPNLEAGSGPVLRLYFTISSSATPTQSAPIVLDGYLTYLPMFYGPILDYEPSLVAGIVTLPFTCGDADSDDIVNMLDILFLINYLYKGGPIPIIQIAADADSSGSIDMLDILYLINNLYKGGPAPTC
jgi:PKD repeat protein